ncbi:MAG: maleylpyruvate isomerase N-terminal domain-containing protein [Actinomycetota bacterium]
MSSDRPDVEQNTRERERLRALVARLDDDDLRSSIYEDWTVAGVLGHIAFWDAWALALVRKVERGDPFSPSDAEADDVDTLNDATRLLIDSIAPRAAAELAVRLAEETDRRVASLPPERMYPNDADSPLNAVRALHRAEHLDDIEAALGAPRGSGAP